ncbi:MULTISPECIES: ABC transporter permease [unclassified Leifsonia]|uniref:ABC transporter permease n=1 Tax=unclassified Leifsonia TaxID=2663824 RepID=UPI0006F61E3C|nr:MULTISPECIES: ABC transporter permease [unclassified Leifsonia]KQX04961.1 ABC transporter permease [Leifsonia sp. Root1293]KRA08593.1 ABC transporter permease [Leifsonia sp. Root60]
MTRTSFSETDAETGVLLGSGAPRRGRGAPRLVIGKVVGAALVLFGAATAAFFAQASLPGDRATVILNIRAGQAVARTPEELAPINAEYHLHDPLVVQYFAYLRGLVLGDLGNSYQQHRPVIAIIADQLGATIVLTLTALVFAWIIMVVWVTLTAGRGGASRAIGGFFDTVAAGLPHYWLGIILLLVFALSLGWFPVIGGSGPVGLVLPALTLAIPLAGFLGQATRTEFERALDSPFVLTARMRGMGDVAIRLRHVLRHAVLPAVTLSGWALGATISGAVVVEAVFARPGIGQVLVTAVSSQDMPVVIGIVMLIAAFYVLANLLVDIAYAIIDPRLRRTA